MKLVVVESNEFQLPQIIEIFVCELKANKTSFSILKSGLLSQLKHIHTVDMETRIFATNNYDCTRHIILNMFIL